MLTHLNEKNLPKMVDVADKDITKRIAIASGTITMSKEAYTAIKKNTGKKFCRIFMYIWYLRGVYPNILPSV